MYDVTIDQLNELLALESHCMIKRLGEAAPFVAWAAAEDVPALEEMVTEQSEHQRRLVEALTLLDGVPQPAVGDTLSGGLHYLDIHYLLPQVIAEKQKLIEAYRRVIDKLPADAPVRPALTANLANHQSQLARLQAMGQRVA